jgi:hypothetical protein
MLETWIVGLIVMFVATPVGIASFVSARRGAAGAAPVRTTTAMPRRLHRHEADVVAHPAAHKHYHRHVAA